MRHPHVMGIAALINREDALAELLKEPFVAEPGRITDPAAMETFVLAGNATFTLRGKAVRYTYRVRKSEDGKVHFVSVLAGPDNESDYVYVGRLRNGEFALTAKSKLGEDSGPVRAFRWFWIALRRRSAAHLAQLEFWHEARCCRCGRKLTVPGSVASGIGPECAKMMEAA